MKPKDFVRDYQIVPLVDGLIGGTQATRFVIRTKDTHDAVCMLWVDEKPNKVGTYEGHVLWCSLEGYEISGASTRICMENRDRERLVLSLVAKVFKLKEE